MERINHVNVAISLSCTNLFPPQSSISKLLIFTIKFSFYSWNISKIMFFFVCLFSYSENKIFLFKTQRQWTWHKPHPKTTTTGRITSVMSLMLLKCLKPKLPLRAMIFFTFWEDFIFWFRKVLIPLPSSRVYSEFDPMHFRTHWLGTNILTLMNISSLSKTFSFCTWSWLVPQSDLQTSKQNILDMPTTDLSFTHRKIHGHF